ncbi:dynein light chain Tctex-type protein 2B-like [Diadema antillarum]|uniref:dynein light chain Tctex-type protein 2B-like n=1 Tax=Diadema antillarum TaxID=105358 RepID=UPI003A83A2C7
MTSTKATDVDSVENRSTISSPPSSSVRKPSMLTTRRSTGLAVGKSGGRSRLTPDGDRSKMSMRTSQFENNYKLAPDAHFNVGIVEAAVRKTLEAKLAGVEYLPSSVESLTKELSEAVKFDVKSLGFARHKIVSHVIVGPLGGQSVQVASRFVWDDKLDNYASISYQNSSIFAVALVYGVYYE